MAEEKTTKKQVKTKFEIVQVPTEMGLVVRDLETNEDYDVLKLLCKIANDVEQLKQLI
jgi:hypothetical protein